MTDDITMEDWEESKITYWVKTDKEWVDVDQTEFVDIEEDEYGFDLMTFDYEGVTYKSNVVQGSQPY